MSFHRDRPEIGGADPWFEPRRAAEHIGLTRSAVYTLVDRGQLVPTRVGGRLWFRRSRLDAWLDAKGLTLKATAQQLELPHDGLHHEVYVTKRIPARRLGRQGVGCILDKAVVKCVLRRFFERCDAEVERESVPSVCDRSKLGPDGGGCGVKGHWQTGRPRPKLQKYPGQGTEPRACEDCGKVRRLRGYLIAEGKARLCRRCVQKWRWAQPDEGTESWRSRGRQRTREYRDRVLAEIKRLRREGWLITNDVRKRLMLAPTVVTGLVREGRLIATAHRLEGNRLVPVPERETASPVWFFYRDEDVKRFERAYRRRSVDFRRKTARARHGASAERRVNGRLTAVVLAEQDRPIGRPKAAPAKPRQNMLTDEQEAHLDRLLDEGRLSEEAMAIAVAATRGQVRRYKRTADVRRRERAVRAAA